MKKKGAESCILRRNPIKLNFVLSFKMAESKSAEPFSQIVNGFQIPGAFSADNFRSAVGYKPRPDDLFLVTYPKCGTTWVGNILLQIFRKGQPLDSHADMMAKTPFLEMMGAEALDKIARPAPIKTHLPFHLMPWSKEAKYVYVTRNPKDCCVSYFHHMSNLPLHDFHGTFDQFFEIFISGKIDYEDYFAHLLSWYPHRNDPNVLFLTYEELHEDMESAILKMASFIDDEEYAEAIHKDPEVMKNIKKHISFKEMKETMGKSFQQMFSMSEEEMTSAGMPEVMKKVILAAKKNPDSSKATMSNMSQFVRKGVIGDWRNYFSEDQSRKMDEKFAEKTKNTDIPGYFEKYM